MEFIVEQYKRSFKNEPSLDAVVKTCLKLNVSQIEITEVSILLIYA